MPKNFSKPIDPNGIPDSKIVKNRNVKILSINDKTQSLSIEVDARQQSDLTVNIAYFPGWHVFIDGEQVWFKRFNRGLILTIPKGRHTIDVRFIQTPVEVLGNLVSITGVIALLTGIIAPVNSSLRTDEKSEAIPLRRLPRRSVKQNSS